MLALNSKRLAENWCENIKKEAVYEVNSKKFIIENQISYEMLSDEFKAPYTWEEFESLAAKYEKEHEQKHPRHNVYIFGHSLDVTDKDILRKLILNDNVYTTIFYCKKKDKKGKYDNGKKTEDKKLQI